MLKTGMFKNMIACCAILSLSACGYVEKKLHHSKTETVAKTQSLLPENIEGFSLYGNLLSGKLTSTQAIDPSKPLRFKLDFLPKNEFIAYEERSQSVSSSFLVASGFYQYSPKTNNQALLVLNGYDKVNHINFFLNFELTFNKLNQGTFQAKTQEDVQKLAPYSQSGTFVIQSY